MRTSLLASAAALTLSFAAPSYALEPEQLWTEWATWLNAQEGITVPDQPEKAEDGTLIVRDLRAEHTDKEGDTYTAQIPELHLKPVGESVHVIVPEPITLSGTEGHSARLDLSGMHTVLDDAATPGLLGDIAATMTGALTATGSLSPAEVDTTGTVQFDATFEGLDVAFPAGDAEGHATARLNAQNTTMTAEGKDPAGEAVSLHFKNGPFTNELTVENLAEFSAGDPIAAVSKGANIRIIAEQEAGSYGVKIAEEDSTTTWTHADLDMALDRDGVRYASTLTGFDSTAVMPEGMGTFGMGASTMAFDLAFPLFSKEEEQRAHLVLTADELRVHADGPSLPAEIATLTQEPMEMDLDAEATMIITRDIWPTSTTTMEAHEPVVRLTSATLNPSVLAALGARIEGQGSMTVLGDSVAAPLPGPGSATIALHQIGTLFDRLVGVGAITAQDRSHYDMMLRGLGKPGETDPLTYDIERAEDGSLTVNGNPL